MTWPPFHRLVGIAATTLFAGVFLWWSFAQPLPLPSAALPTGDLTVEGERVADQSTWAAARKEGKVIVYGSFPTEAMAPVLRGFTADTGVRTQYLRLTAQQMHARVLAEHAAGKLAADYIDLTDLPMVLSLVEAGILDMPHRVPSFDRLQESTRDSRGRWYQVMRPIMGIGINTAIVPPASQPTRWSDLLDSRWRGKIGVFAIDSGGSGLTVFSLLRNAYGLEFWKALAAQCPRVFATDAPALIDLVRGEISLSITGPLQLLAQQRAGAPVSIVFPNDLVPAFGIWGGISATAPHPHAAGLFLDWMTSRHGGNLIAKAGAYAIHPDSLSPTIDGTVFPAASRLVSWSVKQQVEDRERNIRDWRRIFDSRGSQGAHACVTD